MPTHTSPVGTALSVLAAAAATPWRSSEQEDLEMAVAAFKQLQRLENIRATHPSPYRHTDHAADPDNRHAVSRTEIAIQDRLFEFRVRSAAY